MNNISDFQAHKRDEEWDRVHEAELDRREASAPKCPIHHTPHVLAVGVGGKLYTFGIGGGCSECFFEEQLASQ